MTKPAEWILELDLDRDVAQKLLDAGIATTADWCQFVLDSGSAKKACQRFVAIGLDEAERTAIIKAIWKSMGCEV